MEKDSIKMVNFDVSVRIPEDIHPRAVIVIDENYVGYPFVMSAMFRESIRYIKDKYGENTIGAEIGVYRGENALNVFRYLAPKLLILVDTWAELDITSGEYTHCDENDFKIAKNHLKEVSENRLKWIKKPSVDAVIEVPDGFLDWVYIDGNHSYKNVKEDIIAWTPKVREGGVIAGHDIRTPSVKQAVVEINPEYQSATDDWWFVKR